MSARVAASGPGVSGTVAGTSKAKPVAAVTASTVFPGWTLSRRKRRRSRSNENSARPVTSAAGPPRRHTPGGLVPGALTKSTLGTSTRGLCSSRNRITLGTRK